MKKGFRLLREVDELARFFYVPRRATHLRERRGREAVLGGSRPRLTGVVREMRPRYSGGMEYRGHVKGGVVIFEAEAPPEGAAVRVQLAPETPSSGPTLWEKLRRYSGSVTGLPPDMARNHDHYIHGGPRK